MEFIESTKIFLTPKNLNVSVYMVYTLTFKFLGVRKILV